MSEQQIFSKCTWRLIPFMGLLYLISFIDRTNAGFAALTMNRDLGFSPAVFGFGAGIFFAGYAVFQAPANAILEYMGAKRWVFSIMALWGLLSASTAFVQGPMSFYALRFVLGVAEAGLFPGMLLYLTYWFPRSYQSQVTSNFMVAGLLSFVVGGPLASLVLAMDGIGGLHGWQWLFLIEGLPAFLLSFVVLKLLPDGPSKASWLSPDEKKTVLDRLSTKGAPDHGELLRVIGDTRVLTLGLANFSYQVAFYGVALWLPQIVQAMGFADRETPLIVALLYLGASGTMVLGGRSSSRRDEKIWHVALPWLVAASGFALASASESPPIVLAALAFGLVTFSAAIGPFFSLPSSFLRGTAAAGGIGLFNTFGSAGGFFGPTLIGALRENAGDYGSGLAAIAFGFAFSALIVLGIGRTIMFRTAMVAKAGDT